VSTVHQTDGRTRHTSRDHVVLHRGSSTLADWTPVLILLVSVLTVHQTDGRTPHTPRDHVVLHRGSAEACRAAVLVQLVAVGTGHGALDLRTLAGGGDCSRVGHACAERAVVLIARVAELTSLPAAKFSAHSSRSLRSIAVTFAHTPRREFISISAAAAPDELLTSSVLTVVVPASDHRSAVSGLRRILAVIILISMSSSLRKLQHDHDENNRDAQIACHLPLCRLPY